MTSLYTYLSISYFNAFYFKIKHLKLVNDVFILILNINKKIYNNFIKNGFVYLKKHIFALKNVSRFDELGMQKKKL